MTIAATFLSANMFSVADDKVAEFAAGVRVQADCGAEGYQYGTSAGSSGTTVTLSMDSGSLLTTNLVGVLHGNDVPASLCSHAAQHATGARDALTPVAIGALGLDTSAEVPIGAAATMTAAALGKMHACSGTSADYAVTVPTAVGNAGKLIGIRIAGACTKLVTLTANGSELIDGAASRVMWAGESAVLLSDGVGWSKISGRTLAMQCKLSAATAQSIPSSASTMARMDTAVYDFGGLSDIPNNRICIRRAGKYFILGQGSLSSGPFIISVSANSQSTTIDTTSANGYIPPALTFAVMPLGSTVTLSYYHALGSAKNTYSSPYPTIAVQEFPIW